MGRYLLIYFSFITLVCVGFEIIDLSSHSTERVQWTLSDFRLNIDGESSILVMPENFQVKDKENLEENFSDNVLSTEPLRKPEESTGDLVYRIKEENKVYELFCVEKAFYDCLELLSRYPKLSKKVRKLYVIFPDTPVKNLLFHKSKGQMGSSRLRASKTPLLQSWAQVFYDFYFEVTNSFKRFAPKERGVFLAKKKEWLKKHPSKIEVLKASSFPFEK